MEEVLVGEKRNIILAPNGLGKSCLTRAIRCLDQKKSGKPFTVASKDIINYGISNDDASVSISRDSSNLGQVIFSQKKEEIDVTSGDTIFHVFSEDFIQQEVRELNFKNGEEEERKIVIDSDNIELKKIDDEIASKTELIEQKRHEIGLELEKLEQKLNSKPFNVSKRLAEYRNLTLEEIFKSNIEDKKLDNDKEENLDNSKKIDDAEKTLRYISEAPDENTIIYPFPVSTPEIKQELLEKISEICEKITSTKSVSEKIAKKIKKNKEFYAAGVNLLSEEKTDGEKPFCPFCLQQINNDTEENIIKQYLEFFSSEQNTHMSDISNCIEELEKYKKEVESRKSGAFNIFLWCQENRKYVVKSVIETEKFNINNADNVIKNINIIISKLNEKKENLGLKKKINKEELALSIKIFNEEISFNNSLISEYRTYFTKILKYRKDSQRTLCIEHLNKIKMEHKNDIAEIFQIEKQVTNLQKEKDKLLDGSRTYDAKLKVIKTFVMLLDQFFYGKYKFDQNELTLKLIKYDKSDAEKILSDGEKSILAFCYFIASIHYKVKKISEYKNIILVVDDPVNSLCIEFVHKVSEILRYLSIEENTEDMISWIGNENKERMSFLILTHSSQFFSICLRNRVAGNRGGYYVMKNENEHHTLISQSKNFSILEQQIQYLADVEEGGTKPDFRTGNTVRSVLETINHFFYPKKDLQTFLSDLKSEMELPVPSYLAINDLSHGSLIGENPIDNELKELCIQTLNVIEYLVPGQFENDNKQFRKHIS